MIFPSFCIRRGLHELRISCPFCVHKNSVNEIQHEISPTLFIIEPIIPVNPQQKQHLPKQSLLLSRQVL